MVSFLPCCQCQQVIAGVSLHYTDLHLIYGLPQSARRMCRQLHDAWPYRNRLMISTSARLRILFMNLDASSKFCIRAQIHQRRPFHSPSDFLFKSSAFGGVSCYFCFFENQGRKRYCREVKLRPRAVMGNLDDDVEE